jgi:hypothetical protein
MNLRLVQKDMKIRPTLLLILFSLIITVTGCKKEDNPVSSEQLPPVLYGQVNDAQGNPLEGAAVHYIFDMGFSSLPKISKLQKICPTTLVSFQIPKRTFVTLSFYRWFTRDSLATIIHDSLNAGTYNVSPDSAKLTNGVYIFRLICDSTVVEKTMVMLDLDASTLILTNPLAKTNSSGSFTLPYGIFGFDFPLARVSSSGAPLDTAYISRTIEIVLYKPGYRLYTQTLTLDKTVGMKQTFVLQKQ